MHESSVKRKTISSLFWMLLERGGRAAAELVIQIVLARLLAPEQFGALAIILVFVNVGNVIVQSGLNTAIVQAQEVSQEDSSTVFWLSLIISVLLYFVIFFSAHYLANFYEMPELVWPLRVLSVVLIINAFNGVQVALVQRSMRFSPLFVATLVSVALSGCVGIGLAYIGLGLWALVAQQVLYQACNCLCLAIQIKWKPGAEFNLARAKKLFSFGWKLLVSGLLDRVYQSLSDLVVGKQFSAFSLGLITQGKKYPQAIGSMLDGAIQPVMLSAVAHVQNDSTYVKRLVRRALKTSTYLIMPCMVLLAVISEPVVRLLLGEQWLPAVPFLQMYCVIYMLLPIHTSNLQALNGMGRSDLFLKLELIKKAYGIFLIYLGAFVFNDIYILVGSYILSAVISTFVNAWPNRKVIGYSYLEQVKDICPAFLLTAASAVLAVPVGILALPDLVTILVQAAVMAAAYFGLSKLFKVEALDYLITTVKDVIVLKMG